MPDMTMTMDMITTMDTTMTMSMDMITTMDTRTGAVTLMDWRLRVSIPEWPLRWR
jgi:hypothetical protein